MKKVSSNKHSFSYQNALFIISALIILSSCKKEMKDGSALSSESAGRQANSITDLNLNNVVDTAGLVAWFSFKNGSLADRSSYHNRIVFNNAQLTTDRNGMANNAYYFNGNGSYMEVKNSASLSPGRDISLFAIAKFDDFYSGKCHGNRILNKGFNDGDPGFYTLGTSDDYYTHSMNCSQDVDKAHETFESGFCGTGATDTTDFVQTGHWYHLIYTFGNGVANFYIDGKLTESNPGRVIPSTNSDDLFIGTTNKANTQYPYWFNGSVDQIAIFNRVLNANQVARLSAL